MSSWKDLWLKLSVAELPSLVEGQIKTKHRHWIAKRQGLCQIPESNFDPNWHRRGHFYPLVLVGSDFVNWFFSKISKLFWWWKLTSIGLFWHPVQVSNSKKSCPLEALKMRIFLAFQLPCQTKRLLSKNVEKKLRENRSCTHSYPLSKVQLNVRHITCVFYSWFNFEAYIQNTTNPEKGCEFHNPPKSKVQKSRQSSCFSEFYEKEALHFWKKQRPQNWNQNKEI